MTPTDEAAATEATAPTAKQKIIAAMWRLGQPATAKDIATNAGIGYSTATPVLRSLLGADQAIKTTAGDGNTLWQLTANVDGAEPDETSGDCGAADTADPSTDAPTAATVSDSRDAAGQLVTQPDEPRHDIDDSTDNDADDASEQMLAVAAEDAGEVSAQDITAPAGGAVTDDPTDDTAADTLSGEPAATAASVGSAARSYRKPQRPRRAKGALREAVLAVLRAEPDRAFKIGEICKVIDAGNTDESANKAGPGAVANACDKLVGSADAVRLDGTPVTYQAAG